MQNLQHLFRHAMRLWRCPWANWLQRKREDRALRAMHEPIQPHASDVYRELPEGVSPLFPPVPDYPGRKRMEDQGIRAAWKKEQACARRCEEIAHINAITIPGGVEAVWTMSRQATDEWLEAYKELHRLINDKEKETASARDGSEVSR